MATQDKKPDVNTGELSSQAVALAEQLGRIAGTIEGTAENMMNRASLTDQLTRVRDGAASLLDSLADGAAQGRQSAQKKGAGQTRAAGTRAAGSTSSATGPRARAARAQVDLAQAPGKRHRKPAPSKRGVKKSDLRIPKMRTAEAVRHRRKSYA
jgi:hypothetical protein